MIPNLIHYLAVWQIAAIQNVTNDIETGLVALLDASAARLDISKADLLQSFHGLAHCATIGLKSCG